MSYLTETGTSNTSTPSFLHWCGSTTTLNMVHPFQQHFRSVSSQTHWSIQSHFYQHSFVGLSLWHTWGSFHHVNVSSSTALTHNEVNVRICLRSWSERNSNSVDENDEILPATPRLSHACWWWVTIWPSWDLLTMRAAHLVACPFLNLATLQI